MASKSVKLSGKDSFYTETITMMLCGRGEIVVDLKHITLFYQNGDKIPFPYTKATLTRSLAELMKEIFITQIEDNHPDEAAELADGTKNLVVLSVNGEYHFCLR